jgi:cell division protein FtsI/penicillin-binding protein 2
MSEQAGIFALTIIVGAFALLMVGLLFFLINIAISKGNKYENQSSYQNSGTLEVDACNQ